MNLQTFLFSFCFLLHGFCLDVVSEDNLVITFEFEAVGNKIITEKKRYFFDQYPWSYNPSLIQVGEEFWLTFRYQPDLYNQHWLSDIVIVRLNQNLDPISEPQVLNTRE